MDDLLGLLDDLPSSTPTPAAIDMAWSAPLEQGED